MTLRMPPSFSLFLLSAPTAPLGLTHSPQTLTDTPTQQRRGWGLADRSGGQPWRDLLAFPDSLWETLGDRVGDWTLGPSASLCHKLLLGNRVVSVARGLPGVWRHTGAFTSLPSSHLDQGCSERLAVAGNRLEMHIAQLCPWPAESPGLQVGPSRPRFDRPSWWRLLGTRAEPQTHILLLLCLAPGPSCPQFLRGVL